MSALPISPRSNNVSSTLHTCDAAVARHVPAAAPQLKHPVVARHIATTTTLRETARELGVATAQVAHGKRRDVLVDALLAHVPAADRPAAKIAIPAILAAAQRTGTSDANRLGYLLATAQLESDFGANMTEMGHNKQWFNRTYGGEDGNRPGTDDGFVYRGRGYVQTTRAGRYAEMSHFLRLPDVPMMDGVQPVLDKCGKPRLEPALVADPARLTEPKLAAQALVVGVARNLFTHDAAAAIDKTIPVGRKPGDADFYHARAIVNGIVKDQAQAIAGNAKVYAEVVSSYRNNGLHVSAIK